MIIRSGGCGLLLLLACSSLTSPAMAAVLREASSAVDVKPTPIADVVREIAIPYETFTLRNGLRVIVQPDPHANLVTITLDYLVGSTSEPPRKTGFAHLFEHLMFNGSENAPGNYSLWFQELGADLNGVTTPDRTAYYERVPTAGLERALFLESDRMGYLLGAVSQTTLDEQRGVVQNEKRQADDRPLARVRDHVRQAVYPAGHPYAHSVFGSMSDLNNASLDDVRAWFKAHYAPGNAILTLAGDIDGPTARRLVERYFGAIPAGPISAPPPAPVPEPSSRREETMTDRIGSPRLFRAWATPGSDDPQALALSVALGVMAQPSASEFKQQLLERDAPFSGLSVSLDQADRGGLVVIEGSVREGVDPAVASARLDAAIAQMLTLGAAQDDIERYVTDLVSQRIRTLDSSGASLLATAMRTSGDPEDYRVALDRLARQTPAGVTAAARRWLGRPAYALTVLPGAAAPFEVVGPVLAPMAATAETPAARVRRGDMPPLGAFEDLVFPAPQQARLSNGMEVLYMEGSATPLTQVDLQFDIGAPDAPASASLLPVLVGLFADGSAQRSEAEMSLERDTLGATFAVASQGGQTLASLSALSPNLQPSLDLMAESVMTPSFSDTSLDRQRQAQINALQEGRLQGADVQGAISKLVEGRSDTPPRASDQDWSRATLLAYHQAWIRPEKATLYVASDKPLSEVMPMLERSFGQWRGEGPPGVPASPPRSTPAAPGVYLINQSGSDQALIFGGQTLVFRDDDQRLAAVVANSALGDSFSSRLNTDLRETRGWSYGVQGRVDTRPDGDRYVVSAPVQQDRAAEALAAIQTNIANFLTTAPLTDPEFRLAVDNQVRALPLRYNDGQAFLGAIRENRRLGRPDDYQASLAARYRDLNVETARSAIASALHADRFIWVIVGDTALIGSQLDQHGIAYKVVDDETLAKPVSEGGSDDKPPPRPAQ